MERKEVTRRAKEDIMKFTIMKHQKGYIKFVVKRRERKVIGYIESTNFSDCTIYNKTTAKCHESDTFNEHIGKVIVAHKIFGIKVPEYYLTDYCKDKAENGDIILKDGKHYAVGSHNIVIQRVAFDNYCKGRISSLSDIDYKVVDDTGYIEDITKERNLPQTPRTLSCYDRVKHDCAGGCQGASDCLLAQYFRGERNGMPTKRDMKEYIKELKMSGRAFRKITNDPEFKAEMRAFLDKFRK